MTTMTKADMVENVAKLLKLSKREAKQFVEHFFASIETGLTQGHHVRLSGFGNFSLRDKSERPGRNPKTGESVPVSARRVVTFKPGNKLKEKVELIIPQQDSDAGSTTAN
jgi:integration host factor subunit alpha